MKGENSDGFVLRAGHSDPTSSRLSHRPAVALISVSGTSMRFAGALPSGKPFDGTYRVPEDPDGGGSTVSCGYGIDPAVVRSNRCDPSG